MGWDGRVVAQKRTGFDVEICRSVAKGGIAVRTLGALGILCLVLTLGLALGWAQAPRKTVMVVDFADRVGGWQSTPEAVTTRVINRLRDDQSIRILPRDAVQDALRAAKVETSGILDRDDAQKVATALQADFVVMGEITAFGQKEKGGCVPIVGCLYTNTAAVTIRGKVLSAATGEVLAEPVGESTKTATSGSVTAGYWWTTVSLEDFDSQLVGKATLEAIDKFVGAAVPKLK